MRGHLGWLLLAVIALFGMLIATASAIRREGNWPVGVIFGSVAVLPLVIALVEDTQ